MLRCLRRRQESAVAAGGVPCGERQSQYRVVVDLRIARLVAVGCVAPEIFEFEFQRARVAESGRDLDAPVLEQDL